MTLLAISFHSTRVNVVRSRWQAEKLGKQRGMDAEAFSKRAAGTEGCESYMGGTFLLFHWERNEVCWQIDIDGATGFCWYGGLLFINMLRSNEIVTLDGHGREVYRFSHKHLNNLHTIVPTNRGFLLTSTGTDSIIEIDQRGNLLYEWCALDHGYQRLSNNQERRLDCSLDHRYMLYPTDGHTTHVNSARFAEPDEKTILATLFRQGAVIAIDRQTGQAQTLLSGLRSPHDLRPFPGGGWIISDTVHNQTLVLNKCWQITRRISMDFNWVQSSTPLGDGSIIIADTNHHRLVRIYPENQRSHEVRYFPTEWRIYLVEEVSEELSHFFRCPIAYPFL